MKIVVTGDYRAVPLKIAVVQYLKEQGHTVIDVASDDETTRDNYVTRADNGVKAMRAKTADYGIFLCGSGTGITMRANKHAGIRAATAFSAHTARYMREINNANVLVLPAKEISVLQMENIIQTFFDTAFNTTRQDRVDMLDEMPV